MSNIDDDAEKTFNQYDNEPGDWSENQPRPIMKKSTEVYNDLINPHTKNSIRLIKGIDPDTGYRKTGYGYSGFDEANNADLTTSNLQDDINMGTDFINRCNMFLADLEQIQVLYGIDMTPTFRLILQMRSMYASTTKSIKATLMKALTTERSESTVQRKTFPNQPEQKKGGLFGLGGSKKSEPAQEPMSYE